jgi:uncharacterized protein YndB with AHSA1/START domain
MIKFRTVPSLDISVVIEAPPAAVFDAFFDHDALRIWWQADRSIAIPRVLGPYVIEWLPSANHDEVLGQLGGVFRGTILHLEAAHEFFVADAYWLPRDGNPIGPMALEVACVMEVGAEGEISTRVRVTQKGFEESPRWRRYYEVVESSWTRALNSLKALIENP